MAQEWQSGYFWNGNDPIWNDYIEGSLLVSLLTWMRFDGDGKGAPIDHVILLKSKQVGPMLYFHLNLIEWR